MKHVSNKICREKNTDFVQKLFSPENQAVCETMSKNMVQPERPQMAISRRVACWISKAKRARTHTQKYVILTATNRKVAGSIPDGVTGIFQ
jgi:hypothetical protein